MFHGAKITEFGGSWRGWIDLYCIITGKCNKKNNVAIDKIQITIALLYFLNL
jgi:hypothetical protein